MIFFRVTALILILFLIWPLAAQARSSAGHPDVWLRNEAGERVSPEANSIDPYSPRRTCGGCHSYAVITRGYHFRQGFNRPGIVGMYGEGFDLAVLPEPVAPKQVRNPLAEGLSAYDWIAAGGKAGKLALPSAGFLMPGGGPLEFGRNKRGIPDLSRNLIEGESAGRSPADGDYSSRFTPDRLSHFRESGVVEADCLICHYPGYKIERRNTQLSSRNYRWAATAGAGLGSVKGAIFAYAEPTALPESPGYFAGRWNLRKRPVVEYNWANRSLFSPQGRLKGSVVRREVGQENCLQCHALLDGAASGTSHSARHDAHAKAGFRCADCHGLAGNTAAQRLQHEIAPARLSGMKKVSMRTCAGCHLEGKYRARKELPAKAPNPEKTHARRFPRSTFHFTVISCTGCHAIGQGARGGYLADRSMGYPSWFTAEAIEKVPGPASLAEAAKKPWRPWTVRHDTGAGEMYFAGVPRVTQWFGQVSAGRVVPLRLDHVKAALGKLTLTTARVRSLEGRAGVKTVASENEIAAAIRALQATGVKDPVFVSDRVYRLEGGKPVAGKMPVAHRTALVQHDISRKAYGSGGCRDCHADNAVFFTKARVANIGRFLAKDYPEPREPNAVSPLTEWGLDSVPPMTR